MLNPDIYKRFAGVVFAVGLTASGFVFSQRSIDNVQEVRPQLQQVVECALNHSLTDFVVIDGGRTAEEHANNRANGKSWIRRSKHQDGLAVDVAAYKDGQISYKAEHYYDIAASFDYCSNKYNVPITWGGEWKVQDLMHFELRGVK